MYVFRVSQPDPAIDTSRVEEIPAKEPKFHAVPLKSVLKKRGSGSGPGTPQNTPTQENRPLTLRQELHASFKLVPFSPRANIRFTVARVYPSMRKCWRREELINSTYRNYFYLTSIQSFDIFFFSEEKEPCNSKLIKIMRDSRLKSGLKKLTLFPDCEEVSILKYIVPCICCDLSRLLKKFGERILLGTDVALPMIATVIRRQKRGINVESTSIWGFFSNTSRIETRNSP